MKPAAAGTALRSVPLLVTALVALLCLVACGGSSTSGGGGASTAAASGAANTVMIKDFTFNPSKITVAPGTKIMVTNQDKAAHTMTASDKSFDSGNIDGGQTVAVTAPSKPGDYPFICTYHQFMTGTLTVK